MKQILESCFFYAFIELKQKIKCVFYIDLTANVWLITKNASLNGLLK